MCFSLQLNEPAFICSILSAQAKLQQTLFSLYNTACCDSGEDEYGGDEEVRGRAAGEELEEETGGAVETGFAADDWTFTAQVIRETAGENLV